MQLLELEVDNADALLDSDAFGTGALIRWESSDDGLIFLEFGTTTLLEGIVWYSFADPEGDDTTYYRTRFSKGSPALTEDYSAYSDVFQMGTAPDFYGSVDDLIEMLPDSPPENARNLLTDFLRRATEIVNTRSGRDFFKHPSGSGTETRYFRTDYGSNTLVVLDGIVSVTTVAYASVFGSSYTTLGVENTDWYLDDPVPVLRAPFLSIRLAPYGTLRRWWGGPRMAKVTGVFGFATVPAIIEAGTLALAREMYVMQPSGRGSSSGGAAFGSLAVPEYLPRPTYEAINWGSRLGIHLIN